MQSLLHWLTEYGNAGLFVLLVLGIVGLPVPDETLLVISGYLISRGTFDPAKTFVSGFAGSVCGISISYLLGRTLGHRLVLRYGRYVFVTPERLNTAHRWFEKIGEWLLTVGYFIPAVRHFTALVAGISELGFGKFAAFAYTGAAVWVGTFLALGYVVGENWPSVMGLVHRYTALAVAIAGVGAAVGIWISKRKRS